MTRAYQDTFEDLETKGNSQCQCHIPLSERSRGTRLDSELDSNPASDPDPEAEALDSAGGRAVLENESSRVGEES